jgi:hypothetical protein
MYRFNKDGILRGCSAKTLLLSVDGEEGTLEICEFHFGVSMGRRLLLADGSGDYEEDES